VLDFIVYLIQHRERAVSKSELLSHVWRGIHVGDSAVGRCACLARRIVGASSIRTIHGRGYQWTLPVSVLAGPTSPEGYCSAALPREEAPPSSRH
jgi:DNA-binding winged helix-turn-helix (wHTH) protein